ncbi:MAG: hypothetical protein GF308_11210 [Candidatus Heimdallarchaeota archaeon]|nr:hypothetical protein [Candidatus Heimdallarchaeota archaeon]
MTRSLLTVDLCVFDAQVLEIYQSTINLSTVLLSLKSLQLSIISRN